MPSTASIFRASSCVADTCLPSHHTATPVQRVLGSIKPPASHPPRSSSLRQYSRFQLLVSFHSIPIHTTRHHLSVVFAYQNPALYRFTLYVSIVNKVHATHSRLYYILSILRVLSEICSMDVLPTYQQATARPDWLQLAAPYIAFTDYPSLCRVSRRFWSVFAPQLWRDPCAASKRLGWSTDGGESSLTASAPGPGRHSSVFRQIPDNGGPISCPGRYSS